VAKLKMLLKHWHVEGGVESMSWLIHHKLQIQKNRSKAEF